ncbi:MAG TPA: arylsulfotransferase family protein [Solirubrobacteraceae bacterium]|nr:arylsulfotransferase family protein [Solirubrobacteraceae bacterium]
MRFRGSLRMNLAALVASAGLAGAATAQAEAPGAYTTKGAWSFVSAPGLHPPKLKARGSVQSKKLAPGLFLLDSFPNEAVSGPMTGQGGPLMLDNKLQPVWFAPVATNLVSGDLQQETYNGQPVLVYWQGLVSRTGATTKGEVLVVDQHYRTVARLKAKAPWVVSLHDTAIDGKTIWVTVYRNVSGQNLRPYHGAARGAVLDAGVQQYDLKTGKLLFTWDALNPGHKANISLSDSRQAPPPTSSDAWDAYHVNTVQTLSTGQILVSMRNTWAAYLIDPKTRHIVWTLGGRRSSFKSASNARFAWQHDVHLEPSGRVWLFNDNCCEVRPNHRLGPDSGPSAGMVLKLDLSAHKVSLVAAYRHRPDLFTAFLGSMQLLPNGNAVVGWGSLPYFSELDASGHQLLDVPFPGKDQSYRARFSSNWVGLPSGPPAAVAHNKAGKTTVYVSWNGATEVAKWEVLVGPNATSLAQAVTKPRSGFETSITLSGTAKSVLEVVALDSQGRPLGTSRPFSPR